MEFDQLHVTFRPICMFTRLVYLAYLRMKTIVPAIEASRIVPS